MTSPASTDACMPPSIDEAALDEALQMVAARCGRLSDEQVRSQRRRRQKVTASAVAVSVVALLIAGRSWQAPVPAAPAGWTRTLATRVGERRLSTLPDGSTVRLDGATRVQFAYSDGRRSARLLAGQAFFDVRHDKARPFTVYAGASMARVLGTAFDLDVTRRRVELAVYRGAVGFDPVGAPRGVVVRAGYRSTISGGVVAAPMRFDPSLPDWRQGWIDTDGMRLDDLVEMLGRQTTTKIAAPCEPLASMRVSGRFRIDQPRQLLGAIGQGIGFTVVEDAAGVRLALAR